MSVSLYKKLYGPLLIFGGFLLMFAFQNCAKGVAVNLEPSQDSSVQSKNIVEGNNQQNGQTPVKKNQEDTVVAKKKDQEDTVVAKKKDQDQVGVSTEATSTTPSAACFYPENKVINLTGTTNARFDIDVKFINKCTVQGLISLNRPYITYNSDRVPVRDQNGESVFVHTVPIHDVNAASFSTYVDKLHVDTFINETRGLSDQKKLVLNYSVSSPTGSEQFAITVNADLDFAIGTQRACSKAPANASGGFETYQGKDKWGPCENFSCNQGFILKSGSCVPGCRGGQQYVSWSVANERCNGLPLDLAVGESQRVSEGDGSSVKGSYVDVKCNDSKQYELQKSIPSYGPEFADYLVQQKQDPTKHKITCHNDKLNLAAPRIWGSCRSSNTAKCFAGNSSIQVISGQIVRFYLDDAYLGLMTSETFQNKSVSNILQTKYKVIAKIGDSTTDITSSIHAVPSVSSLGLPSPTNYQPSPNKHFIDVIIGFSPAETADIELSFQATVSNKEYTSSMTIKINAGGENLPDGYVGSGVADFIVNASGFHTTGR